MAIAQQQRIKEDVSVAKRNLFCEVKLSPSGCLHSEQRTHGRSMVCTLLQKVHALPVSTMPVLLCHKPVALLSLCEAILLIVQTCHKQYKSATEMETHLSSYDHHHKKVQCLLKRLCSVALELYPSLLPLSQHAFTQHPNRGV